VCRIASQDKKKAIKDIEKKIKDAVLTCGCYMVGMLGGPLASFRVHPRSLWGFPKMGGWTPKPWHVVLDQPLEQGWQEEADPDRRRGLGFLADGKMWDGLE